MNVDVHFRYWTDADRANLLSASSFSELAKLAMEIMGRFPNTVQMVSGPISTGGVGTIEGNRKVFEGVIDILASRSPTDIFSQMPFEDRMVELYKKWHMEHSKEKYCTPILDDFYDPIFSSGKVSTLNFIHDWESSVGAKWEHDNCERWGIERNYLPKELSTRALHSD